MKLELHIERIVLDGVAMAPGRHALLQTTVEAELTRRLADAGLAPALLAGGTLDRVPAPTIQLTGSAHPKDLGRRIARSVYGAIGR